MTVQFLRSPPAPVPMASVQGTLALDYGNTVRFTRAPDLRVLPGARAELEAFAHRFASAVVEVIGGDRGPSQLLRWTTERVYADLQRRCAAARRHDGRRHPGLRRLRGQVRSGDGAPPRCPRWPSYRGMSATGERCPSRRSLHGSSTWTAVGAAPPCSSAEPADRAAPTTTCD